MARIVFTVVAPTPRHHVNNTTLISRLRQRHLLGLVGIAAAATIDRHLPFVHVGDDYGKRICQR